jgi:precorrin-6B methylase 1
MEIIMEQKKIVIGVITPSEIAKILAKNGINIGDNNIVVHKFSENAENAHISIKTPEEAAKIIKNFQNKETKPNPIAQKNKR